MKLNAPDHVARDAADTAITTVLAAERAARDEVERAQREAQAAAEHARAAARALADRTERRIRLVVAAFDTDLARRLAEVEAQALRFAQPHRLEKAETAALDDAIAALVRELTGGRP